MSTLGDEYPLELARVRELLDVYRGIPTGAFGAAVISQVLQRAEKAQADGDVVGMLRSYEELKGCE